MVQSLQPSKRHMPYPIKIGILVAGIAVMLPIVAIVVLFVGVSEFEPSQTVRREVQLANHGSLIIDGKARSRSEHGFSQRADTGHRDRLRSNGLGMCQTELSLRVYQAGSLVVVIDVPAAQLYVQTHVVHAETRPEQYGGGGRHNRQALVRPLGAENWKNLALIFPDDLGPFPISFYAERNGLTTAEVSQINELGGKRERKYPTTDIQSFDPQTRDLRCSYQVDNTSSWPLHLRLSEDGTHLALVGIGRSSP